MRPDKALLGDKVGDYDGAKVAGFIALIWGLVLCTIHNELGLQIAFLGGGMMLGKCWRENT